MKIDDHDGKLWSGYPDPCDPDNYWIDDDTGERVSAVTGERSEHGCQAETDTAQTGGGR